MKYSFVIKGAPLIWQRPKAFYNKKASRMWHYDPQQKERKDLSVALLALRIMSGKGVLTGDLVLRATFHYQPHGKRRMDVSNMIKALEDSGNGVLWEDDAQIFRIEAEKSKCLIGEPRTEVEIEEVYDI